MKVRIVLVSITLGVLIAFCLSGAASAYTETGSVIPIVNVDPSGSLAISGDIDENNVMDFGHMTPGATTTKTLTLDVSANANWQITVTKSQDLTYANTGAAIPSDRFTFTSGAGTPEPPGTPTYSSNTQFGTGTPVVMGGSATESCQVNVVYKLEIPDAQPVGYYSAGSHTYTLIVGQ